MNGKVWAAANPRCQLEGRCVLPTLFYDWSSIATCRISQRSSTPFCCINIWRTSGSPLVNSVTCGYRLSLTFRCPILDQKKSSVECQRSCRRVGRNFLDGAANHGPTSLAFWSRHSLHVAEFEWLGTLLRSQRWRVSNQQPISSTINEANLVPRIEIK